MCAVLSGIKTLVTTVYAWILYVKWIADRDDNCTNADKGMAFVAVVIAIECLHVGLGCLGFVLSLFFSTIPFEQCFKNKYLRTVVYYPLWIIWKCVVVMINYFAGSLCFFLGFYGLVCGVVLFVAFWTVGNGQFPSGFVSSCGGVYKLGLIYVENAWTDPLFYWDALRTDYETITDVLTKHIFVFQTVEVVQIVMELITSLTAHLMCCASQGQLAAN